MEEFRPIIVEIIGDKIWLKISGMVHTKIIYAGAMKNKEL